jgi:hypothetical protein
MHATRETAAVMILGGAGGRVMRGVMLFNGDDTIIRRDDLIAATRRPLWGHSGVRFGRPRGNRKHMRAHQAAYFYLSVLSVR